MPKFMLLLTGGDYESLSSAEMEAAYSKFRDWFVQLSEQKLLVDSAQLAPGRTIVKPGNPPIVTDGPFAESKEVVGGYFTVTAQDQAEAAKIAKGCPALLYGGAVEVRPIMERGG